MFIAEKKTGMQVHIMQMIQIRIPVINYYDKLAPDRLISTTVDSEILTTLL